MSSFPGLEGSMEGLQAIHPSQLSIQSHDRLAQLSIDSSGGGYSPGFSPHTTPNNNNNSSMATSTYISSIMSEPCLFPGAGMDYGIGQSEQPDTKDGLEELCPVCGDKVGGRLVIGIVIIIIIIVIVIVRIIIHIFIFLFSLIVINPCFIITDLLFCVIINLSIIINCFLLSVISNVTFINLLLVSSTTSVSLIVSFLLNSFGFGSLFWVNIKETILSPFIAP